MRIVIYGLTITSSWGNGHATTYRSLTKALKQRGHTVQFVEKDVEWYRSNRDLPEPEFCTVQLYNDWSTDAKAVVQASAGADAIVVGSYFPDAVALTRELLIAGRGPVLFYDIDTPITMSRLQKEGGTEYLDAELIPHYAAYLSFTGGPALTVLEERYGSPWAVPFYCSWTRRRIGRQRAGRRSGVTSAISGRMLRTGREADAAAGWIRFPAAAAKIPGGRAAVSRGNCLGTEHRADNSHFAGGASGVLFFIAVTLNLTRDDMAIAGYSPSVRLFEASACGAAIVSDAWDGLEDFLTPSEEVLLPSDEYDMVKILTEMRTSSAHEWGGGREKGYWSSIHRLTERRSLSG